MVEAVVLVWARLKPRVERRDGCLFFRVDAAMKSSGQK